MAKLNFGGVEENVVTREEFPLAKAQEVLKDEVVAVIGYGVQGPGQALNQKENGVNVIVGQRKNSKSWDKAVADGFVPGETLFEIEEALERGTIICYLLSDAAQIQLWPTVKKHLTKGKALYFSHGFGITYNDQTGIVPPPDVDVLRAKGHSPSEAFNETVEELTQSLMPLVAENGMDWMYANCSTTAQRGALDWWKKFRDATLPVFNDLYDSVAAGKEAAKSIESNSKADYREKLEVELKELRDSEMWQT